MKKEYTEELNKMKSDKNFDIKQIIEKGKININNNENNKKR